MESSGIRAPHVADAKRTSTGRKPLSAELRPNSALVAMVADVPDVSHGD